MSRTTLLWQTRDLDQALEDQSLEPWMARAYEELRAKILDEAFPCTFGTSAQKMGDLYYAFAEPDDLDRLHQATPETIRPVATHAVSSARSCTNTTGCRPVRHSRTMDRIITGNGNNTRCPMTMIRAMRFAQGDRQQPVVRGAVRCLTAHIPTNIHV